TLELTRGTHTLTFEKQGYWSVTKTIDVQGDTTVSVEMYPDLAAFKLENFPAEIKTYQNTIYELTFTLSPIQTSATYNTYLSISGLSDVIEVRKDGSVISPEGGKYYLGDISGPTQISIKFKAGAVG
ncbi:PEGA domain-containing protein, partial [Thermococcus sp. M39]|uniref:PEGA domain-containing protein n=4 Tax=unclassified Thermococcus TaxID=2627626 RepID=UPI00143923B8